MSDPHTFVRGAAPRHLELARQAIRRAEIGTEPLEWSITRAIDAALREAADVATLSGDGRTLVMARALAILRLRGSLTPVELGTAMGWRYQSQAQAVLHRLTVAGYARRAGWGRYVPAQPVAVGRPSNAMRAAVAASACAADASASPAPAPRPRAAARVRRHPAA